MYKQTQFIDCTTEILVNIFTPKTLMNVLALFKTVGIMKGRGGIGWYGASSGEPVYRVYNPTSRGGDHYYTMSRYEAQTLVNKGWRWDNNGAPAFYSAGNTNYMFLIILMLNLVLTTTQPISLSKTVFYKIVGNMEVPHFMSAVQEATFHHLHKQFGKAG